MRRGRRPHSALDDGIGVEEEIALGEHGALGDARGTRGIKYLRHVILSTAMSREPEPLSSRSRRGPSSYGPVVISHAKGLLRDLR